MSHVVDKVVRLSDERAQQLEELAAARGVTEDALIEEALDLLFQEPEDIIDIDAELRKDWEYLQQLEAELGPLPPLRTVPPIDPNMIVSVIGVPIDPKLIRRGRKER